VIRCDRPNGETVWISHGYAFRAPHSSYDAWGQRRIAGRLFHIPTMSIQRDAVATGPPWATDDEIVAHAFKEVT